MVGAQPTPACALLGLTPKQVRELQAAFDQIDVNCDGLITPDELNVMLEAIDFECSAKGRDRDIEIIMSAADANKDGALSRDEFNRFLTGTGNWAETVVWGPASYPHWGALKRGIGTIHSGDIATLETIDAAYSLDLGGFQLPVFIPVISCIQLAIFVYMWDDQCRGTSQAISCPDSHGSVLAYRPCCRDEPWRWLSYAFAHAGWDHVLTNIILQCFFGLYLEVINGPKRVMAVYGCGVLAGSLASSICDPATNLVGASGADYALVGAWVAYTWINWDTMSSVKYKIALIQFVLVAADVANSVVKYQAAADGVQTSFAGHGGGFLLGVTYGCYILKNARTTLPDVWLGWFGISFAMSGIIFGVVYNLYANPDITQSCEAFAHRCTWNSTNTWHGGAQG